MQDLTPLRIELFTDPGCPFAWSAEPQRRRIQWLYGDQIEWAPRMVVLSERPEDYLAKGFDPPKQAASFERIRERYGMPIDASERPRMTATVHSCRAFVAARRHAPDQADAMLRRLRVHHLALADLIDDPETIDAAAREAGVDPAQLRGWCAEPETEQELREDARAARSPLPAARHMDHKLAGPPEERRYTCPTWILHAHEGPALVAPGFQPIEVYEALVANAAPQLERRDDPESVEEVLRWASEPLSAAEVAAVMGKELSDVREELERLAPSGEEGFYGGAASADFRISVVLPT